MMHPSRFFGLLLLLLAIFRQRAAWLPLCLVSLSLTACGTSLPPLPATPDSPALTVAVLSPTAGELATVGRSLRNGIQLAFDEINAQGGVAGQRLTWQLYNTDCTFESGQHAAQTAIAEGHRLLLGPLCSEAAIAAAQVAAGYDTLLIAPAATHPLVTVDAQGQQRPTVFTVSYGWTWQGEMAARFAREELAAERAALLLTAGDDYDAAIGRAFARQFIADGGQVVYQADYTIGQTDLMALFEATAEAEPGLLFVPADAATANRIVGGYKMLGLADGPPPLLFLGSDSWQQPSLDRGVVDGSYLPRHFTTTDPRPTPQAWAERYRAAYAIEPVALAALGYDAAGLLIQAVADSGGQTDPPTLATAIAQTDYQGITGPFTFDTEHTPRKSISFVQLQDGDTIFVTRLLP